MPTRAGKRAQAFKNAAQLHDIRMDRRYKRRAEVLMEKDYERDQRIYAMEQRREVPHPKKKAEQDYTWENYMKELKEKYC
ncbi:hypothetical protein AGMMS49944_03960 [Spirochaetia bacterium]|nr:hypothetical protein AGMMS49944_03960 [Spirochaetia bacterium]